MLPRHPSTTMQSNRKDSQNLNVYGERNMDQRARKQPAMAPMAAEIV